MRDEPSGTAWVARVALVLCALALLLIYFSGRHDDEAAVAFVVTLFILTVAALT